MAPASWARLIGLKIGMVIATRTVTYVTNTLAVAMHAGNGCRRKTITIFVKDIVCLAPRGRSIQFISNDMPRVIGLTLTHRTRIAEKLL